MWRAQKPVPAALDSPYGSGLILFAGLYESWYPAQNQPELTFTIITCVANAAISPIHDRMPVILNESKAEDWMNPREPQPSSLQAATRSHAQ